MARLQELLSQSVTQTLGLSDLLARKQEQARFGGQAQLNASNIGVNAELLKQAEIKQAQEERKQGEAGLFGTVGMILGGAAGFALGGPAGAAAGAKLGSGLGRAVSPAPNAPITTGESLISTGIDTFATLSSAAEASKVKAQETAFDQGIKLEEVERKEEANRIAAEQTTYDRGRDIIKDEIERDKIAATKASKTVTETTKQADKDIKKATEELEAAATSAITKMINSKLETLSTPVEKLFFKGKAGEDRYDIEKKQPIAVATIAEIDSKIRKIELDTRLSESVRNRLVQRLRTFSNDLGDQESKGWKRNWEITY